jgi:uncharacterized membrane protein
VAKKSAHPARHQETAPPPAWEIVALAATGAALALYLTITKLTRTAPLMCGAGSSCDLVQGSAYGVLLGVPTALWGAVLYVALGLLAIRPLTRRRWLWSFGLAVGGVAFSAYLTAVSLFVLRAACIWCVASALIVVAIAAALLRRRPAPGTRWPWLQPARLAVLAGLVAVATVGLSYAVFSATGPASPYQEALARHLRDSGARFYGASWCPACREQKRLFGTAASELPYVECDAASAGARTDLCVQANVRNFPTWTIRGGRHEGVLPLATLANLSAFTPKTAP